MKILIAQINSTVGDFRGNFERMNRVLKSDSSADLVVFPECVLCGYPPQDLLDYPDFARDCETWAEKIVTENPQRSFVFGTIERNRSGVGKPLRNIALVAQKGKATHRYAKRLLPTYDVFDEDRFFEPGREAVTFEFLGKKIGLTICEDIWNQGHLESLHNRYAQNPLAEMSSVDLLLNISASPFEFSKVKLKQEMLSNLSQKYGFHLLYVNAVGANDSLIFDGRSYFFTPEGQLLHQGIAFREELKELDTERTKITSELSSVPEIQEIYSALCAAIEDYCRKEKFSSVILGLSGGIDSSVVACLAADALGPENVVGVLLPSRFTSAESNQDALGLARVMQNPVHIVPIETLHSAGIFSLSKAFEGLEEDQTEENLQSRIRGLLIMALSNKFGHLPLTTGNKSELATGYCTLYGDMNGGLAPLADVYKTQVYALGREANRRWQRIPERVFTKAPTAELRPNQTDQDTLPPYERLDELLKLILEDFSSRRSLMEKGFSEEEVDRVLRWISRNEFKRFQMPLGFKVSSKAFGIGRRIPIVHRFFHSN